MCRGECSFTHAQDNKDMTTQGAVRRRRVPRKATSRFASFVRSNVSHSQMTATRHPTAFRRSCVRASRSMLSANFSAQNAARVLGVVVREQPGCRCQKHPWTKTAFRSFGKTKSGVPGRLRRWSRKRYPSACAHRRTTISGLECLLLTRAISAERLGSTGPPGRIRLSRHFVAGRICM